MVGEFLFGIYLEPVQAIMKFHWLCPLTKLNKIIGAVPAPHFQEETIQNIYKRMDKYLILINCRWFGDVRRPSDENLVLKRNTHTINY